MMTFISEKFLVNTALSIVLISFLLMISGCGYYKVTTKTIEQPSSIIYQLTQELYPEKKFPRQYYPESNLEQKLWMEYEFYIIDSRGQWSLKDPMTKGDTLIARAINSRLPSEDNPENDHYRNAKKFDKSVEQEIITRIKLYVDTLHFWSGDTALVPFSSVKKYDIYKNDNRRDAGVAIAVTGGLAVLALVIAIGVAIGNYEPSSTTSCPFIYTYDKETWVFNGEIFGGAIFKSLERDDYLALRADGASPGSTYKVKMANMLPEVQYINQAELIIVNHDTDVKVFIDRYGEVQTISEAVRPSSAYDSRGNNVFGLISDIDMKTYNFDENPDTSVSCMNHLDLVFSSPSKPDSCKILVAGHNSLWIDLLARGLQERLGKNYPFWVRLMDRKPAEKQMEWVLSQGLPLQIYLLKGEEWQLADYFDIAGPLAAREMVLPLNVRDAWSIDVSDTATRYNLNVRIVTGYNFWELDYTAIDFTENAMVDKIAILPDRVIDQDSVDVSGLLVKDDRHYLIQREIGEEAVLDFIIPDNFNPSGSIFLHSKGYYHQVIERNGKSELAFIWSFLKPGRLSEWSYENYLKFQEMLARND